MSHTDFTGNKLFGGTSLAFWFGKKTTSAKFLCAAKDVPKDACKLLFHFFYVFFLNFLYILFLLGIFDACFVAILLQCDQTKLNSCHMMHPTNFV